MSINQNPAPVNSIRVRAVGDPGQLSDSVRQALHEVDPALPIIEIVPLATELNGDLGTEKLLARLAGVYASLTLLARRHWFLRCYVVAYHAPQKRVRHSPCARRHSAPHSDAHRRADRCASFSPASCPVQFYRFSRCAQQVIFYTALSARIRSQSSQQASCSHSPVPSPRSSPLGARRLPIRWKHSAVNNRHPSPYWLACPMLVESA